ncbi:MAG TPA: alpha-N-arabinofuranosidase [Spirochaetia bacterium]|nr:alpha-N-arabinofuranosidase [Spirochaetia bacterium]
MANRIVINSDTGTDVIDRNIYGHFAEHLGRCIYDGIWVGESSPVANIHGIRTDIVNALKEIGAPVVRWPGGCFADEYHWKDGIGPRAARKSMINTHWGGEAESNHFGTHEFFEFCRLIGAEPYVCGNVGSGTVQEMQEWIEYMNGAEGSPMADLRAQNGSREPFKLTYFGVGNENWGCGGNMRAEYYADLYRRFQTFVRSYNGQKIFKVACGPRNDDYHWTDVLMRDAGNLVDGLALHYYSRLFSTGANYDEERGSATQFEEDQWFRILHHALRTDTYIRGHKAIMDRYDPKKRVALIVDEWGTWYESEPGTNRTHLYQQNTIRDALVAGISLNIFNNHADRVRMANIAQTVNVLQAMVLTNGAQMLLTPTYHVFHMYRVHQGATLLPVAIQSGNYAFGDESLPQLNASASLAVESGAAGGSVNLTVCNLDPAKTADLLCEVRGRTVARVEAETLTGARMNAHNTFDRPDLVQPVNHAAQLAGDGTIRCTLPPMSVTRITMR